MFKEHSHWTWYERLTGFLVKNYPQIQNIEPGRRAKISALLKQASYEIAGGLRYGDSDTSTKNDTSELNEEAVKKLKDLSI